MITAEPHMTNATNPSTMTAEDEVKTPIVITAYEKLRSIVTGLVEDNANKVFVYSDPKDNKLARSHVFGLRTIKADIGRARVEAKADALEYGRQVDAVAKDLTRLIDDAIAVHQAPLDEIDEIEAKEKDRKTGHQAYVDLIKFPRMMVNKTSAEYAELLAKYKRMPTDNLEEFKGQADAELLETLRWLEEAQATAVGKEAEAIELLRLRTEAAERVEADRVVEIARKAVDAERQRAAAAVCGARIAREARERADAEAAQMAVQAKKDREATEATAAAIKREADAKAAEQAAITAKADAEARVAAAEARVAEDAARRAKELADQVVRDEAAKVAAETNRAAVIAAIVASLRALAVDGKSPSAQTLAETIAAGKVAHLSVDWTI
jgi:hypothetical protein